MNPFVARSVMRGLINGRSYCGSSINSGHRYSPAIVGRGAQLSGQQIGVLFGWRRMMPAPASVTKAPLEKEERKENPAMEKKNEKENMVSIFETCCDRYGKKYSSEEEKSYRLKIFEENYTYVTRNNMVNPDYVMAINEYSDLNDDDFKATPPGGAIFGVTYEDEVKDLEDKVKDLEDEMEELEDQVEELDDQVKELDDEVKEFEDEVKELEDKVKKLEEDEGFRRNEDVLDARKKLDQLRLTLRRLRRPL